MNLKKPNPKNDLSQFSVVKIMRKLSKKELIEFQKLINSPFYNNYKTVSELFAELKNYHPEYNDPKLTKESLFITVNPGKLYNDILFQKYMSRLKMLSEEYLNIIEMRSEPLKKEINVLNQLSILGEVDFYNMKLKVLEKSLEENNIVSWDHFLYKHFLANTKNSHFKRQNVQKSNSKIIIDSYNCLQNYFIFISTYTLDQLHLNNFAYREPLKLQPSGTFFNKSKVQKLLSEMIENADKNDKRRTVFLELLLNDFKINFGKNEMSAYRNMKEIVINNAGELGLPMQMFYLKKMISYCTIQNAKGKADMNKELFEIYKFIIRKEIFVVNNTFTLGFRDFRLIVSSSLRSNESLWLEDFINNYLNYFSEELNSNLFHYGYAHLLFHKKEFEKSLDHISDIIFNSRDLSLDIYFLKAKIFYELDFKDSAIAFADTFRHYISNNKFLADFLKNLIVNFLAFYKKILKLRNKPNKALVKDLLNDLEKSNNLREKKWLIEKTNEMLT